MVQMVPPQQGFRTVITGHLQSSHPPHFSFLLSFFSFIFSHLIGSKALSNDPGPKTPLWPPLAVHALPEDNIHNWDLVFLSTANLPTLRVLCHVPEHLGASSWTMWDNSWLSHMHNEFGTHALTSTTFSI